MRREPRVRDTFLWRICIALDEPPRMLAANIGVSYEDIKPLLSARHTLADIDRDEVWWLINEYVAKKLGHLLAVRAELNKALQNDRKKRAARLERFKKL